MLKRRGFKWSPKRKAWVRKLTKAAVIDAEYIIKKYYKVKEGPGLEAKVSGAMSGWVMTIHKVANEIKYRIEKWMISRKEKPQVNMEVKKDGYPWKYEVELSAPINRGLNGELEVSIYAEASYIEHKDDINVHGVLWARLRSKRYPACDTSYDIVYKTPKDMLHNADKDFANLIDKFMQCVAEEHEAETWGEVFYAEPEVEVEEEEKEIPPELIERALREEKPPEKLWWEKYIEHAERIIASVERLEDLTPEIKRRKEALINTINSFIRRIKEGKIDPIEADKMISSFEHEAMRIGDLVRYEKAKRVAEETEKKPEEEKPKEEIEEVTPEEEGLRFIKTKLSNAYEAELTLQGFPNAKVPVDYIKELATKVYSGELTQVEAMIKVLSRAKKDAADLKLKKTIKPKERLEEKPTTEEELIEYVKKRAERLGLPTEELVQCLPIAELAHMITEGRATLGDVEEVINMAILEAKTPKVLCKIDWDKVLPKRGKLDIIKVEDRILKQVERVVKEVERKAKVPTMAPPTRKVTERKMPAKKKEFEYGKIKISVDDVANVWSDVLEHGLQYALRKYTRGYLPNKALKAFVEWWVNQIEMAEPKAFRDWLFRSPPWDKVLWEVVFTYGIEDYFWGLIRDIYNKYKGQLLRLDRTMTYDKFKKLVLEYLWNFFDVLEAGA